jgi:beta-phosphoglucomutase
VHGDYEAEARQTLDAWARQPRRGVIFDFNGTLSDDEPILLEIFTEIFAERLGRTLTTDEYYSNLAGLSDREIIATIVEESTPDNDALVEELLTIRAERYLDKVTAHPPIKPGTVALVSRLAAAAVPIAVVTGAQRSEVRHVLRSSAVGQHIEVVVTEEDVSRGKPDPEGFLTGARLLNRQPQDILVFEDSVPGVLAAHAARMRCIAVAAGGPTAALAEITPASVPALTPDLLDSAPGFGSKT